MRQSLVVVAGSVEPQSSTVTPASRKNQLPAGKMNHSLKGMKSSSELNG